jgi:phosphoribosyl 1,2-cyclic phosphodiesterase
MHVRFWGVRGSIPTPDRDRLRYGGNTSCVSVGLDGGGELILDAGSGIRALGERLYGRRGPYHILLTHLHLDHIMGLMFFAPFFDPSAEVTVWGPPGATRGLRRSLSRYLSSPLSPIEIRELPADVAFSEVPTKPWRVLGAEVCADLVTHRGRTLGYRIEEGGCSLCYLPDHEPGLGQDLERAPREWISGFRLASDADLLLHDGQYTREEYRTTIGWGHSCLDDSLRFARRAEAARTVLVHHDPAHDDRFLDEVSGWAAAEWGAVGGAAEGLSLASEGAEIQV